MAATNSKEIGKAHVEISADISKLNKELNNAEKATENATKSLSKKLQATGKKMSSIGLKMTLGVTTAIGGIGAAVTKMAMDAEESENLFEVSMGNMADATREWSEDLREELGLNEYETRKYASTFNVMLNSMGLGETAAYDMSKGLTELSYDMASFYNLKPEEAFQKLQAGISGEIEPLKRLGILINENTIQQVAYANGIAEAGDQLTEQQKVQARYLAIMEQTSKAQGDLARTIDSPTNQLRILKAELEQVGIEFGQALIPALQDGIEILRKFTSWLSDLDEGQRKNIVKMAAFAAAIGPVLLGLGKILTIAPKVATGLKAIKTAMTGISLSSAAAVAGIAAIAAAIALLVIEQAKLKQDIAEGTLENVEFNNQMMKTALANITKVEDEKIASLNEQLQAAETAYETETEYLRNSLDDQIALRKSELEEQKDLEEEAYENTIAQIREEYGYVKETTQSKTDISNQYYENEIAKAKEAHNEKIALIDEELAKQLQMLDAETQEKVIALQNEIDRIDAQTQAEEEALDRQAEADKVAALEAKVRAAKTAEDRKEAEADLADYLAELKRAELLRQRELEKDNLEARIQEIKNAAEEEADIYKAEAERKIAEAEAELEGQIERLNIKKEAAVLAIQEEREAAEAAAQAMYEARQAGLDKEITALEDETSSYIAELQTQIDEKIKAEDAKLAATKERIAAEIEELNKLKGEAVQASGIAEAYSNMQAMSKYQELNDQLQEALEHPFSLEVMARGGIAGYTRRLEDEEERLRELGIAGFATGGMAQAGQLFMANEKEPEVIVPESKLSDAIAAYERAASRAPESGMAAQKIEHSGTITVRGVDDKNQLIDIVEVIVQDTMRTEGRVYGR